MRTPSHAELARLFASGWLRKGGANAPIPLDKPDAVWWIERGTFDVFVAEVQDGEVKSAFRHVLRADANRMLFGIGEIASETSRVLIAKGLPGSRIWQFSLQSVLDAGLADYFEFQVESWIAGLSKAVSRDVEDSGIAHIAVGPGQDKNIESGETLAASSGVVWLVGTKLGLFLDVEDCGHFRAVPVTRESWVRAVEPTNVRALSTRDLAEQGILAESLATFHSLLLSADSIVQQLALVDAAGMQVEFAKRRQSAVAHARRRLFRLLHATPERAEDEGSALLAALRVVGEHEGISFLKPAHWQRREGDSAPLTRVLRASGVRGRPVAIDPRERWWRGDCGALLAFRKDDGCPVAIVPTRLGGYRYHDPSEGTAGRVTDSVARELADMAWMFYRPLPEDGGQSLDSLYALAARKTAADAVRFAGVGLSVTILSLVSPIALGILVSRVIPTSSTTQLIHLVVGMIILALGSGTLQALQGATLLRLEGRIAARLGSALWDRMLDLPKRFYRRFTAGDLAVRALAFQTLRDTVSGGIAGAAVSSVFLFPALVLIFAYDLGLGWLSLGMGTTSLLVTVAAGLRQIRPQREHFKQVRRVGSELFQFLGGIGKIRAAGAEGMAFAKWASRYRSQKAAEFRIESLNAHLVAFNAAMPMLAGAGLLAAFRGREAEGMTAGDFLAAYGIVMLFLASVRRLGLSFRGIAEVVPSLEQVKVILDETSDKSTQGASPGELRGGILFDRVSFKYSEGRPLVLDEVTVRVEPGEFVALVGESGSGKSTLLQLGLGLERPLSGTVHFDGKDLTRLNQREVRRQIGVVLQNSGPQPGSVVDNIIGMGKSLTTDDAWRAAKLACIDADIAALPMGMMTVIGDSLTTFSGGQLQRIMIASALARKPRLLFLDEATNWLDTETQVKVVNNVRDLSVTLLATAHRLSSIASADRVYVMKKGRVVQEGKPKELLEQPGPFQQLARRQLI